MKLKLNKTDIFVFIFSFVLIVAILVSSILITGNVNGKNKYVVIRINGEVKFKYDLNVDKEIELKQEDYPSLLGDMLIEIKDKKVRVKKEESPKNYCSKQGWVSNTGLPIVCLPNSVIVTIIGVSDSDLDWQV